MQLTGLASRRGFKIDIPVMRPLRHILVSIALKNGKVKERDDALVEPKTGFPEIDHHAGSHISLRDTCWHVQAIELSRRSLIHPVQRTCVAGVTGPPPFASSIMVKAPVS
jgi:hypothetical protein